MEMKTATPRFLKERFKSSKSLMPAAIPIPMIGPIKGEINMAPMMTAVELTFRPTEALPLVVI